MKKLAIKTSQESTDGVWANELAALAMDMSAIISGRG